jgi:hypothetical protein
MPATFAQLDYKKTTKQEILRLYTQQDVCITILEYKQQYKVVGYYNWRNAALHATLPMYLQMLKDGCMYLCR